MSPKISTWLNFFGAYCKGQRHGHGHDSMHHCGFWFCSQYNQKKQQKKVPYSCTMQSSCYIPLDDFFLKLSLRERNKKKSSSKYLKWTSHQKFCIHFFPSSSNLVYKHITETVTYGNLPVPFMFFCFGCFSEHDCGYMSKLKLTVGYTWVLVRDNC